MKSIKEFAEELEVSEKTISRHIQRLNLKTIRKGTKHLLDDDAQQLIRQSIADISDIVDRHTRQDISDISDIQDSVAKPKNISYRTPKQTSGQDIEDTIADSKADKQDSLEAYKIKCEMLQKQVDLMQKTIDRLEKENNKLNERLDKAEAERDTLTKERQTILAELLELRKPKVIEIPIKEKPKPEKAQKPKPRPQKKQKPFSLMGIFRKERKR